MTRPGVDRSIMQSVDLSMQDLAVMREALIRQRDGIRTAVEPYGLMSTWDSATRVEDVLGKVTEARCDLKRRQHPDYNPAGDSECSAYATNDEQDRWYREHPDKDEPA